MTKTPKTLNQKDAVTLIQALERSQGTFGKQRRGLRNKLIGLLMLDCGLRVGELVLLKINDLIINCHSVESVLIRAEIAKRNHERIVPLTARTQIAITQMYLHRWKIECSNYDAWGFYSKDNSRHITTRQVERIILAAAMWSLHRPIFPHMLRHTFASRLMRITNARVVMELLGHKNLSSTQVYCHPNSDDLKDAVRGLE